MAISSETGNAGMFGNRITLFNLFGFAVRIDASWIFIALLVTWSLAEGYFPQNLKGYSHALYWLLGLLGALGLFASIVFHEFWHSLVARRYGLPMKGITLFIFGGISEMSEEPPNAKTEFLMAAAGPLSSIVLGAGFFFAFWVGKLSRWPLPVTSLLGYLAFINWVLAGFNLLPAFPLDGGRILRSALWKWKNDLQWATRLASRFGSVFGLTLIAFGLLNFFTGNLIGGLWYCVIGLFLRGAAQSAYQQVLVRRSLEGRTVGDLMAPHPVVVPPTISLETLVEDFVYRHHFKMFPVVENGAVLGCVTTRRLKEVARDEWTLRSVREIMIPCSEENSIRPDAPLAEAFALMNRTGNSRLMVLDQDRLAGIISLKDISSVLALRMELGN
jgi:Zn-dependent protease/CBS domain-containing protein